MDVDKIVVIAVVASFCLGPQRLVASSRQLAVFVRQVRDWADATKAQIEEETGVDVDWSDLDPRRYDPRRIIREALAQPDEPGPPGEAGTTPVVRPAGPAGGGR
ncbi:Sec-independent protein translocase TatB [Curtobacterium luteum]|uniref:Sec-independent protein translocase TatB n=1 Tax=Curtobacterium luteum TaxID=33881 RepID=UPI0038297EC5